MREETPLLLLNHPFDLELVAGLTQSEKGNYLDFIVDRPNGMNGYMLQLTTFGKGYAFDGKQHLIMQPGQLLLFAPNAMQHYYRYSESQYWHYKWIYFYPHPKWGKWLNWVNSEQNIGRIMIKEHRYLQEISQIFSKIEQELKYGSSFKEDIATSLLEYLLIKCISAEKIAIDHAMDSRILKVCDFISEDLAKNLSIDLLAERVYLSPSRLSHLFKQSLGISLVQWRELQRVSEAKKLLYFSDIPISTLAKSLGYDDPFYFSKVFKRHTRLSPSQFRAMERDKTICDPDRNL
ncbi:arabinose operon transcriptional regulator AraC [Pasteurella oralis]|uniref:Arabinose operon transcriptional regulator AraC n=1 Tax=Pasteurella oralis TaxID=1071947 RepID=A0ABW4NXE8_9PAST|nr:arabinose operon transcriptional regulator AraC [Pasteurella oralis]